MKLTNQNLTSVKLNTIKSDLTDFRDKTEERKDRESEEFEQLKFSIRTHGVVTPIHLAETSKGLELIDGRRRILAARQLGLVEVPAIIIQGKTEQDLAVVTLIQNLHRKNLNDIEKARGTAKLFKLHGYDLKTVIGYVKTLHNLKTQGKTPEIKDKKFMAVFESLGFEPNTLYEWLKWESHLKDGVLEYAQKRGLDSHKKTILTHSALSNHPQIQKMLVDDIADSDINVKRARTIVQKTAGELESGAIYRDERGHYHGGIADNRQTGIITEKPEIAKSALTNYLDIMGGCHDMLKLLTGHTITRGEFEYSNKTIEYSEQYRKDIVNAIDERSAVALINRLGILSKAVASLYEHLERRYPSSS
jgi:hypothetical protein